MPLWLLIFIGFLIVSFLLLIALTFWQMHISYRNERQKFADLTGLHVTRTSTDTAAVLGFYRERQVQIDHIFSRSRPTFSIYRGSGRGKFLNIRIIVKNKANLQFILEPHRFRHVGLDDWQPIKTGAKEFDKRFFLAGNPENGVLKLFDSASLQNGLLKEFYRNFSGAVFLELDKGILAYEYYEHPLYSSNNAMQLQFLINLLSDLADEIDQ